MIKNNQMECGQQDHKAKHKANIQTPTGPQLCPRLAQMREKPSPKRESRIKGDLSMIRKQYKLCKDRIRKLIFLSCKTNKAMVNKAAAMIHQAKDH